jgi:DnaJ homolog subfamily C member 9
MDNDNPLAQFFPDDPDVDLYDVMGLKSEATQDDIKRAYRRLALQYHPDRHASADEEKRVAASTKFKQIGFAYSVLSDETRRKKYDTTGSVEEGLGLDAGEGGWDAYFADLFERVTKGKLDEMKKQYQGEYTTSVWYFV